MEWISWVSEKLWDPAQQEADRKAQIARAAEEQTRLQRDDGEWECFLRADVQRSYMRRYVVYFLFKKGFQGIATGPRTLSFHQDESDRACVCRFGRLEDGRKRMSITCQHGTPPSFDAESSAAAFFECILLELSYALAEDHLLLFQAYKEEPEIQTPAGDISIVRENAMLFHARRRWTAFLRPESEHETVKTLLGLLYEKRFEVVPSDAEKLAELHSIRSEAVGAEIARDEVVLENYGLHLRVYVMLAMNSVTQLMVHVTYESFREAMAKQRKRRYDDEEESGEEESGEEDSEEEEDFRPEGALDIVPVAQTGDPTMRKGDVQYFESVFLALGSALAGEDLLQSQSFENQFPSNAPIEVQRFQERALVDFEVKRTVPITSMVDFFLAKRTK